MPQFQLVAPPVKEASWLDQLYPLFMRRDGNHDERLARELARADTSPASAARTEGERLTARAMISSSVRESGAGSNPSGIMGITRPSTPTCRPRRTWEVRWLASAWSNA